MARLGAGDTSGGGSDDSTDDTTDDQTSDPTDVPARGGGAADPDSGDGGGGGTDGGNGGNGDGGSGLAGGRTTPRDFGDGGDSGDPTDQPARGGGPTPEPPEDTTQPEETEPPDETQPPKDTTPPEEDIEQGETQREQLEPRETPEPEQGLEDVAKAGQVDAVNFEERVLEERPNLEAEDVRVVEQDGTLKAELTTTGQEALTADQLGLSEEDIAITEEGGVIGVTETGQAQLSIEGIAEGIEQEYPEYESFSINQEKTGVFDVEVETPSGTEEFFAGQGAEVFVQDRNEQIAEQREQARNEAINDLEKTLNQQVGEARADAIAPTSRTVGAPLDAGDIDLERYEDYTIKESKTASGETEFQAVLSDDYVNEFQKLSGERQLENQLNVDLQPSDVKITDGQVELKSAAEQAITEQRTEESETTATENQYEGLPDDFFMPENVGPQSGVATDPETIRSAEVDPGVLEAYRGEDVEGFDSPRTLQAGLFSAEQEETLKEKGQAFQQSVDEFFGVEGSTGVGRFARTTGASVANVANVPQWLTSIETTAETAQKTPEVIAEEGAVDTLETFTAGGREVAEAAGEQLVEDPAGSAGAIVGNLGVAIGAPKAASRGLAFTRGKLATKGMDFQGEISMSQLERPDVSSGTSRLTRFSEEAVPGGKRSIDPDDFPVETATGDPAQELRNLADEFSDPELEKALETGSDEFTLFSARSGTKADEFVPRSGRPYDPDAAFFSGSVSSNFLDVPESSGALSGGGLRFPRPIEGTKSLIRAAKGEDTPTIVATAGKIDEFPEDVAGQAAESQFLRQQTGSGTFFTRRPETQSGEAEALISARAADKDVDYPTTSEAEATQFVKQGDPFKTEFGGETVPIQLFRPATKSDVDAGDVDVFSESDIAKLSTSRSVPGGRSGTPVNPAPLFGGESATSSTADSPGESAFTSAKTTTTLSETGLEDFDTAATTTSLTNELSDSLSGFSRSIATETDTTSFTTDSPDGIGSGTDSLFDGSPTSLTTSPTGFDSPTGSPTAPGSPTGSPTAPGSPTGSPFSTPTVPGTGESSKPPNTFSKPKPDDVEEEKILQDFEALDREFSTGIASVEDLLEDE